MTRIKHWLSDCWGWLLMVTLSLAFFSAVAISLLTGVTPVFAQTGQNVTISQGPPIVPYQKLLFYSGSNLQYICTANSTNPQETMTVTAATLANPGVFTSTGHSYSTLSRPRIRFLTGPTFWTSIVGSWIMVPVDANTFTINNATTGTPLNTSGFGGAWSGTANFVSQAPRTSSAYWAVQWLQYDGNNNLTATMNAYAAKGLAGVKCDDRAAGYTEWR